MGAAVGKKSHETDSPGDWCRSCGRHVPPADTLRHGKARARAMSHFREAHPALIRAVEPPPLAYPASLDLTDGGAPTPSEWWATPPTSGERALLLAVLEDAVRCARGRGASSGSRYSPSAKRDRLRDEARAWIADDGQGYPFAFVTVCDALGLEPDAIRRALTEPPTLRLVGGA